MPSPDRFIASCSSWDHFWERASKLSNTEKGIAFERLTQLYLQTAPEYRTKLRNVWLLRDIPTDIRGRLNLPGPDEGIDLIARTRGGEFWAIQSKFRSQRDKPLTRRELGTFTSLVFQTCSNIDLAVVAHTASKPVSKRRLMRSTVEIGLDRWQSLDDNNHETWKLIVGRLKGRGARPEPRSPKPHQRAAISAAKAHFIGDNAARGRLIMPCGTGKSLAAYWIAEALGAKNILVAVPSLALIRQGLADWTREFLARNVVPDWICVCSDETVGNLERDEFVGEVYELGLPTHTDPKEITALLRVRSNGPKIVFTTYQSSDKLAAAARQAGIRFDLGILDEAHKTVGARRKRFATLLRKRNINIGRRLFMTATERIFRGDREDVLSMDNEKDYGKCFFQMSYKNAIKQHIISDYKILTVTVSDSHIRRLIEKNRILNLDLRDLDEAEAQSVATGIALKRVFKKQKIKHAISFHSSIRAADHFRGQQDIFNHISETGPKTRNFHISSHKTAGERSELLREFVSHKRTLITNARCLTEGVDIPAADCVVFADPKQSLIDIVQAAGRALRRFPGKDYGYILLPLIVPPRMQFEEFAETTAFRQVVRTITALSTHDERIAEEFQILEHGRIPKDGPVIIPSEVRVGMKMNFHDFAEAISTRIWESVGRANWRAFDEARVFARGLNLKATREWRDYCKSGKKPPDIPAKPAEVYANRGWVGFSDWLGTGRLWQPFSKARAFVRKLGLKSYTEWEDYTKSGNKPADIPSAPFAVYANAGWIGMGDWLGTGLIDPRLRQYRPFNKARTFVRDLALKSVSEWSDYCASHKKPADIPMHPDRRYAKEWIGWGDWLGTRTVAPQLRKYRSFEKARAFARGLGLKSQGEWQEYCKSGRKPFDIPANPASIYAKLGWSGTGDWLGTGTVAPRFRQYRSFKKGRAFVRGLGLKSHAEWLNYCQSGKKPSDIPNYPAGVYANAGWAGTGDWLGTGIRPGHWRTFKKAREYVRRLGLKSVNEWFSYCKSGKKPLDIPTAAHNVYADKGWVGMGNWLGTGTIAPQLRLYRSFEKARAFAWHLSLKSQNEWFKYCRSGKKPEDIPYSVQRYYAKAGWAGWGDWLGTGRVANQLRQHELSRKPARLHAVSN
jgi:superfamily II DNA or RNA helicase